MSVSKFFSNFNKVIIHKILAFIVFTALFTIISFFLYYKTLITHVRQVIQHKIKYGRFLLENRFKKNLTLLSYLASSKSKAILKILTFSQDDLYAIIETDKNGNILKFYNIKGHKFDLNPCIIKKKLKILKLYEKKVDSKFLYISPIYPNFLGYQNCFFVALPDIEKGKKKYLFAIFDPSFTGLLKDTYFYLFSNLNRDLNVKYKIKYLYFDKPGINGISIDYKIDQTSIALVAAKKIFYISLLLALFYLLSATADLLFASQTLYQDFKLLKEFINTKNYQCNKLSLNSFREICKKLRAIFSYINSKEKETDLLIDSLNIIVKENKNIKDMIKDITSLLKILVPCEEICIGIFDISKGMSVFSGSSLDLSKEKIFEEIRKKLKGKNFLKEGKSIFIKYAFYPFEIYYNFDKCKRDLDYEKLQDLLDIVNLLIITALKLYNNSIQDPLTGAFNREKLLYDLTELLAVHKRYGDPFSIIMFDIDHFKKINDTYGHDAGDLVLKMLIKTIKNSLRKENVIYRYGGEEFIILLPRTKLEDAIKLAERLREKISYIRIPYGNSIITFTASFGVTQAKKEDTIDTLIKRVDTALYKAKNNGRNRVEYAS